MDNWLADNWPVDIWPVTFLRGIVFTHGVRMDGQAFSWAGGQVGGRREKGCLGCISETIRCMKLILGRDIG